MAIQERNSEMVSLLSVDFIRKTDSGYLAGLLTGTILILPGLVAFWPMGISLSDDNTIYADSLQVTGQLGEDWTALPYVAGWEDYGSGYQGGQYKKVGDLVLIRGRIKRTSGTSALIATLPSGYRPPAIVPCPILTSNTGVSDNIDIASDGTMTLTAGGVASVILTGIWISTL
jgi:hypothetical protein